jgi:cytochrome P450
VAGPRVVDLGDAAFWQDPYPEWHAAREQHRTAVTAIGEPIVLRADDAELTATHPGFGQLGLGSLERLGVKDGPFYEWRRRTMNVVDGDEHTRLRAVVARAFTPRRVEVVRADTYAHARELLDAAAEHDHVDFLTDYAADLPLWLICRFLGLPVDARADVARFLAGTEEAFTDPLTAEGRARAEAGVVALGDYVEALIADRRAAPAEDLVSDLLEAEADDRIHHDELVALVVNVIGGAVGSSRAAIANTLLLLVQHPGVAAWVRADPERVRPTVEEALRFHPPFRSGRRVATRAVQDFGLDLAPGDTVFLARQAANRDPRRFADPDRFDPSRFASPVSSGRGDARQVSFGYGPHFCLGQALARLDLDEALRAFLDHPVRWRLAVEPRRIPFTIDEQLDALWLERAT